MFYILQARVMLNRNKVTKEFGKSKGFGFVEFKEHSHALKALRVLNNNPSIFTPQKRPIVEFSIENKVALNIKQKRLNSNKNKKIVDNFTNLDNDMDINNNCDEQQQYIGVISKPNRKEDKIKTPKVNRKLNEKRKQLKIRGKQLNKQKKNKEKSIIRVRKQKNHQKSNKKDDKQIDSEMRHFNKRKHVFTSKYSYDNNSQNDFKAHKKLKWYQ
jgi:nucleolar protein 4